MTGPELLGLVMLILLLGVIFIGFPIAFTLLFLAFSFGLIGLGPRVFDLAYFQIIGLMKEEVLAAVPLFIFMGYVTEQAGLMERLFLAFRDLLAPVRGALFLVVILTATVFAMATGIVGAAVTVLGIMAAPVMIKSAYDPRLSAGAIAAGGTLGILIPPSVMLVVMGPVIGVSVAQLYAAAFGPGLVLATLYIVYCLARSFVNPRLGPPVPVEERVHSAATIAREVVVGVVPLALLITATLGSILGGLATPTEAAGVGATGALILAALYGRLTLSALKGAVFGTLTTSSMVLFLAVASNVFGAVFARTRHRGRHHRHIARLAVAAVRHAPPGHGVDLPSGLAVRMAGHHPGVSADPLSRGSGAGLQPALVRRTGGGKPADCLPVAARRHVGLLPQAGRTELGPRHDLSWHGRLHGHPGDRSSTGHAVSRDRLVVPGLSVRPVIGSYWGNDQPIAPAVSWLRCFEDPALRLRIAWATGGDGSFGMMKGSLGHLHYLNPIQGSNSPRVSHYASASSRMGTRPALSHPLPTLSLPAEGF